MKHNMHNPDVQFYYEPQEFNKWSDKDVLKYCLGGALYMPSTKNIVEKILNFSIPELTTMVMCFEDAIKEEELPQGEKSVLSQLDILSEAITNNTLEYNQLPLIFLRVRDLEQFISFSDKLTYEQLRVITGFVFPKFYSDNAHAYLERLKEINDLFKTKIYGMPILEGKTIAYCESRVAELEKIKLIIDSYSSYILNVRIGGTDFSSLFGVRRGITSTVYDILPVRDSISAILNFFTRMDDGYIVSAPVWEYFLAYNQDDIQQYVLNNIHIALGTKEAIVNEAIDGLLREVVQDKANGMVGKTVIHPSHLRFVNAMQAVTLEEYNDAIQILTAGGGVIKSQDGNKMNEIGPHRNWAMKVKCRAFAYGVIADENEYLTLFKE